MVVVRTFVMATVFGAEVKQKNQIEIGYDDETNSIIIDDQFINLGEFIEAMQHHDIRIELV